MESTAVFVVLGRHGNVVCPCISSRRLHWCYTEKASPTRHRPEHQHNARSNRRKQCSPNETQPNSNIHPRKIHNYPTHSHTPSRIKSTHTRCTYTGIRPHAPGQQAGDHPIPAHTERHNPSKVWTQRQARSPRELSAHRGIGIAGGWRRGVVGGWRGASHGQGRVGGFDEGKKG